MEKVNILHQCNPIILTKLCRSKQWNSQAICHINIFSELRWIEQVGQVCQKNCDILFAASDAKFIFTNVKMESNNKFKSIYQVVQKKWHNF